VELGGDAYAWFDVQAVTPAKLKEFETIKGDVKADAIEAEKTKKVSEMADAIVERLNKGEDIGKIAAEAGGKVESLPDLKRNISPPGMTEDAMRRAFILAKGTAGHTATSDGTSRVVYRVDDIKAAAPAAPQEADDETKELQAQLQNGYLFTYIDGLKNRLGVTIDEAAFKRITGADAQQ
jgi:peptidyl-prolyl cis-trans isomerase D